MKTFRRFTFGSVLTFVVILSVAFPAALATRRGHEIYRLRGERDALQRELAVTRRDLHAADWQQGRFSAELDTLRPLAARLRALEAGAVLPKGTRSIRLYHARFLNNTKADKGGGNRLD